MTESTSTTDKQLIYSLVKKAAQAALDMKARDIVILDLRDITSMTDFFIICTGDIDLHVKSIADEIKRQLKKDIKPWHIEGYNNQEWILLDFFDFVIHVFQEEKREYYNLDKLWADAPVEKIE